MLRAQVCCRHAIFQEGAQRRSAYERTCERQDFGEIGDDETTRPAQARIEEMPSTRSFDAAVIVA